MDTGSTGMEWYTGNMDPDGKIAKLTATIYDAITLKPTKLEMRLTMSPDGNHVTELWQADAERQDVRKYGTHVHPQEVLTLDKGDCHDAKPI